MFVHDYPQGRRPVNIVNPHSVRLFRSMIGSWSPRGPIPLTYVAVTCPSRLKFRARIAMHMYEFIDENNILLDNDHLPSFLATPFLPTGCCASNYRQHRLHVEQFLTPLPICVITHGGFLGCTNHSGYYQCRTAHVARMGERTRSWRFRFPGARSESYRDAVPQTKFSHSCRSFVKSRRA